MLRKGVQVFQTSSARLFVGLYLLFLSTASVFGFHVHHIDPADVSIVHTQKLSPQDFRNAEKADACAEPCAPENLIEHLFDHGALLGSSYGISRQKIQVIYCHPKIASPQKLPKKYFRNIYTFSANVFIRLISVKVYPNPPPFV